MFFTFPEDAHWNADRQAVEFGVEIGEYRGVVRVPRRVFQRLLPERPAPARCVEAYYLQRTRLEGIAERKIRRRQLTDDGNVEINGNVLETMGTIRPELRSWDAAACCSGPISTKSVRWLYRPASSCLSSQDL